MPITSTDQRKSLRENGFLVLHDLIPPRTVRAARKCLNAALGRQGARNTLFREYAETHGGDDAIARLLVGTQVLPAVQELVSPDVKADPFAQVALRFPSPDDPTGPADVEASPERLVRMTPHIDGIKQMPHIDLPTPKQVHVRSGDVIVAHYLLGHGIAQNLSPNVRHTVYFRADHPSRSALVAPAPESPRDRVNVPFTALIGVQLTDLDYDDGGNLVVWPGTHTLYQKYYIEHPDEAVFEFTYTDFLKDIWAEWEGVAGLA